MELSGIKYSKPTVKLMQSGNLLVGELAGRIAYDSFTNSEHESIKNFNINNLDNFDFEENIEDSKLLSQLAWVNHHHSVLEHINLSYLIQGTSRGVLHEIVRHRIAAYTVRSTRYTMSSIIFAFIAAKLKGDYNSFYNIINSLDMFVTTNTEYNNIEIKTFWEKLSYQMRTIGKEQFYKISLATDNIKYIDNLTQDCTIEEVYNILNSNKKKRNVGDNFKHLITDNVKVDLVMTMNLRSLKNFFELRDSGAAYFQIEALAKIMKEQTPIKYMRLIDKKLKDK